MWAQLFKYEQSIVPLPRETQMCPNSDPCWLCASYNPSRSNQLQSILVTAIQSLGSFKLNVYIYSYANFYYNRRNINNCFYAHCSFAHVGPLQLTTFELCFVLEGGDRSGGDLGFFCQSNWAALEGCSAPVF